MARRLRAGALARSLRRTLDAMTRAGSLAAARALSAGGGLAPKPVRKARKLAPKRPRLPAVARTVRAVRAARGVLPAGCVAGRALAAAGARRFLLYVPPGVHRDERLPLVVMLHGCGQDAQGFVASTGMNRVAARERFLVLYPEQDRLSHPHGCWNWYGGRSGRARGEMAILTAAIDQVCLFHPADPGAVAVAGLSAGASMAALLAASEPSRFVAVIMHSGVPLGSGASAATALRAMRGRGTASALAAGFPPSLLAIHGDADRVVDPVNSRAAFTQWAEAASGRVHPPRTIRRGSRRPMVLTDCRGDDGRVTTLCEIAGLGHAWSGGDDRHRFGDATGPDASRLAWTFVARELARRGSVRPVAGSADAGRT